MISRIWHGYSLKENADNFENILKNEAFIKTKNQNIKGYHGIDLLRREVENEIEFITIMWFDTIESIIEFAGTDYENAVIHEKAQKLLTHYDSKVQHYNVIHKD